MLDCTATRLDVVELLPSWPLAFEPQAQTVASDLTARPWSSSSPLMATAVAALSPLTCAGTELLVVELLPSWPEGLPPQSHTVPSDLRAMLCRSPPAIASTPLRPLTWMGEED